MNETVPFRFRIGIINDFRGIFAFLDYQNFGSVQILDAAQIKHEPKQYQESKDSIGIFFNFKLVKEFKQKSEALQYLTHLLNSAPTEVKKEFEPHFNLLIESIEQPSTPIY